MSYRNTTVLTHSPGGAHATFDAAFADIASPMHSSENVQLDKAVYAFIDPEVDRYVQM